MAVSSQMVLPRPSALARTFFSLTKEPQTGTLSSLLTLSDTLPKLDSQFTSTVSKLLDTLRGLLEDPSKLHQHARVNDRSAEEYLFPSASGSTGSGWRWDKGRWGNDGKVTDVIDALTKVSNASFRPMIPPCITFLGVRGPVRGPFLGGGMSADLVQQEMNSIEATQKQKSQSYNLAKGSLTTLERKRT